MRPREVFSRCQDVLRRRTDRRELQSPRPRFSGNLAEISARCVQLIPGSCEEQISQLRSAHGSLFASLLDQTKSEADRVLQGQIELLGESISLEDLDWHRDPLSDYRWPRDFFGDVQIYELPADVKYVWELSRHQFLTPLAQTWLFTGDDRYSQRCRQLWLDWIDENPLYVGVNWTSGLEVALRSISWLWMLAATSRWEGWRQDESASKLIASLADHAHFLRHHLSHYSSPYNHLIGEASALLMLAFVLSDHDDASDWKKVAHDVLVKQGPRQFYGDGFTVEQATGYHFFTLGFFLQAVSAARRLELPLDGLTPSLARATHAATVFERPDGTWPCIGDLDSARSIPLAHDHFWDFRGICAAAATLLDCSDVGARYKDEADETFWLAGIEGVRQLQAFGRGPTTSSLNVLPQAGYASWSNEQGDWAMLDCGPVGDGVHADETMSVAHGHDDALSVHLTYRRQHVLQDSGMLRYAGSRDWVDYLRSEHAHNRVVIEGLSGMHNAGRLAWNRVVQQTDLTTDSHSDFVVMRGNLRLPNSVRIQRCLVAGTECGIWVVDWVRLDRNRNSEWRWHVPEESQLTPAGPLRLDGGSFSIRSWCSHETELVVTGPSNQHPDAWHAPGYGVKIPGKRISHSVKNATCVATVTHIGNPDATMRMESDSHSWDLSASSETRLKLPQQPDSFDLEKVLWHPQSSHAPVQVSCSSTA